MANAPYVNPNGLSVEDFEAGLDGLLAQKSRINQKELEVYFVPRRQGDDARLAVDADYQLHKMALSRKK